MANPYRAFRQLERKIFRGVPEQPEPVWQRDLNAHVAERLTGKSQLTSSLPSAATEGATLISTVVYRPASEEILYEEPGPSSGEPSTVEPPAPSQRASDPNV